MYRTGPRLPAPSSWLVLLFLFRQTPSQALAVSGMVDSIVHYRMDEMGENGGYVVQLVSHYKGLWGIQVRKCTLEQGQTNIPKIILLDSANGIDSSHVRLDTQDLKTQAGSFLNHLIGVVSVLWRHGVRLPFNIGGNVLVGCQLCMALKEEEGTHLSRNEDR